MSKLTDFKVGDWFALYTSYCPDGEDCSDDNVCDECKRMSNTYRVDAVGYGHKLLFNPQFVATSSCLMDSTRCSVVVDNEEDYNRFAPMCVMVNSLTKIDKMS